MAEVTIKAFGWANVMNVAQKMRNVEATEPELEEAANEGLDALLSYKETVDFFYESAPDEDLTLFLNERAHYALDVLTRMLVAGMI